MDLIQLYGIILCFPAISAGGYTTVLLDKACEVFESPGTFLAYKGEKRYFRCMWNGDEDVREFSWTFNGDSWQPPAQFTQTEPQKQMIQMSNLDDSHSGIYSCTVKTTNNVTSTATMTVKLQGSLPVIQMHPEDAVLGSTVTMTCNHSILNVSEIVWYVDGVSLMALSRSWVDFSGESGEIVTVRDLNPDSAENYSCKTRSKLLCRGAGKSMQRVVSEKMSKEYPLVVRFPIQLKLSPSQDTIDLLAQDNYDVTCRQTHGDLPISISWYKDGVPVTSLDFLQIVPFSNGSILKIFKAKPYMSGRYQCKGWNKYGNDVKSFTLKVPDDNGQSIQKLSDTPGVGTEARLMCHDSNIHMDYDKISWYKDGALQAKPHPFYLYDRNILVIPVLKRSDEGVYMCRYKDKNSPVIFNSTLYELDVIDVPPKPVNLTVLKENTTANSIMVTWAFSSDQDTNATEIKIVAKIANNAEPHPDPGMEYTLPCEEGVCPTMAPLTGLRPGSLYEVTVISHNTYGHYSVSDSVRETTGSAQKLTKGPDDYLKLIVGVVAGCLVVFVAVSFIVFKHHKKGYKKKVYDKIEKELGYTISKTLHKPDTFDYPYQKLQFIETVGEGAFGKVVKAEAPGLKCPQGSQTVAVKMTRDSETEYERQELLDEIDILTKLGVHQHIIPLLGTCTKPGKPTCLITQYMPDGDLQNYLRLSRPSFVGTYPFRPVSADSFVPLVSVHNMSNLNTSDDTITSKDLISFARQISSGMEFVSSKKIVHRDLAARNVLVASKRSLKITDFGLARETRGVNEEYVMGPNRKVPYRWLAPESFFNKKFTVHSDVWAYGVLLYEILTLGGSPYPGHTIRDIPAMLKQKYRMSPPRNSKPELNRLMTECWAETPEDRPSFTDIKSRLDELLGDRPEEYLDCGDPDAEIVPNINSDDNKDMDKLFRYSFLARHDVSSIAVQGYDRIADAHSAYGTLAVGIDPNTLQFGPLIPMNQIKSNPIPDTYQHLPVMQPSPDLSDLSDRKNSAQYMNHDMGQLPVLVNSDFVCGTENFVSQKL